MMMVIETAVMIETVETVVVMMVMVMMVVDGVQ